MPVRVWQCQLGSVQPTWGSFGALP